MTTAIYIKDSVTQLVLTPDTDFERDALKKFDGHSMDTFMYIGSFYETNGGWIRHGECDDRSLIIRLNHKPTHVQNTAQS